MTDISWRCFHCDEVFTDRAEAAEHFGAYIDDSPLCLVKGADGGLAKRIRELETELTEALNERNRYENDARLWHEAEADRQRRIGHRQWWQEIDAREGEKLVLLERIAELTTPRAFTTFGEEWKRSIAYNLALGRHSSQEPGHHDAFEVCSHASCKAARELVRVP